MPLTPLHLIPGLVIYLLLFSYVDLLALALAVVFIDIEPIANLLMFKSSPLHGPFHSLVGALLIATPALILACRLLERRTNAIVRAFRIIGWNPKARRVSLITTAFSAYLGVGTHLILDYQMHPDVSVFYPFSSGNPFLSETLTIWSHTALFLGLIASPLLWYIGKRVHKERPFRFFP